MAWYTERTKESTVHVCPLAQIVNIEIQLNQKRHLGKTNYLASRLKDVSHGESPVCCPLFPNVVTVVCVPIEAEFRETKQFEDGLCLSVDLRLLPLAVRRLRHQGLKAEASGDSGARQCCVVLVPQVDSDNWTIC